MVNIEEIVIDILGMYSSYKDITPYTLFKDLHLDVVDTTMILFETEKQLKIEINEDVINFKLVNEYIEFIKIIYRSQKNNDKIN